MNDFSKLKVGQKIQIHSYKHNEKIHRVWKYGFIVEVSKDRLVVVNNKTRVIESSGRVWYTKEPAVCYFYTNEWFNVISMLRSNGIHFYCNIASPSLWDGEAVKYIDYDLDLKVFPNNTIKILDEKEYANHAISMNYSKELDHILNRELENLELKVINGSDIFSKERVYHYYEQYKKIVEQKKSRMK